MCSEYSWNQHPIFYVVFFKVFTQIEFMFPKLEGINMLKVSPATLNKLQWNHQLVVKRFSFKKTSPESR